jgi:hypothetical protein
MMKNFKRFENLPRFFCKLDFDIFKQYVHVCVCVNGMRPMIIGTLREKFDSGCYRIHMFSMVSSD